MDFSFSLITALTLPSLVVFIASFLIMKKFFDSDYQRRVFELKINSQKIITPIRLQAYERLTLFIERVSIYSLLKAYDVSKIKAYTLHRSLLNTINSEFNHNLSQQIYISIKTWESIKTVKDNTIEIINQAFKECVNESNVNTPEKLKNIPAALLGKKIIHIYLDKDEDYIKQTLLILKKEIRTYF